MPSDEVLKDFYAAEVERLTAENARLAGQVAALRAALAPYSAHRLSLMTNQAADVVRATGGADLLTEGQLLARFDMLREYVCRTVPPMLEALRKASAALAAGGEGRDE